MSALSALSDSTTNQPGADPADQPPHLDPVAAARWIRRPRPVAAWLSEEVGRRMVERLEWIRLQPQRWLHWQPLWDGPAVHAAVRGRYADAQVCMAVSWPAPVVAPAPGWRQPWWHVSRWRRPDQWVAADARPAAVSGVDLLWANLSLHLSPRPATLLRQWNGWLRPDGFVMLSALGPDTARELRSVYRDAGWGEAGQGFTDMHDWGDLLVRAGFAEPVMDMEHLTLTFRSVERLVDELRGLGRNLHPARARATRGRRWHRLWLQELEDRWPRNAQGEFPLTLELIYGHAMKGQPRRKGSAPSTVTVDSLRADLARRRLDRTGAD